MWMFKPFSGKEQTGLEGRLIEIGNERLRVQNVIAEGGFSCVYLAHDAANLSKQFAVKHMICQDGESLDLAMKEIQVMKLLKGHPNVVTLLAHSILDMGRRKEVLLMLEFCEESLVNVVESRGAAYFEEKKVLSIFRDVCNAVFAMHSLSPPIAHRDLKAENVLLGSEGAWKLCDFGSTSTNHKCFDRPEEMGIEEDNIRKHTTPAYRAPEMWDLYRRELICEKVDIWALGCLLYRICYFKSAFDGESKLQILNGNFRIPELPKYSASLIGLIKDMLQGSPNDRPDITQVWFRVNELLPVELQKHLPDRAEPVNVSPDVHNEGSPNRIPVKPRRSPPPPPSFKEKGGNSSPQPPMVGASGNHMGAFWSTQFAQDSQVVEDKGPLFDEEPVSQTLKNTQINQGRTSFSVEQRAQPSQTGIYKGVEDGRTEDFKIRSSQENKATFQNESFRAFVGDFDSNMNNNITKSRREEVLEAEMGKLKEQLKQSNLEKAEITSKYEKLSSICRSQRKELQELKLALAALSPPSVKDSRSHGFGNLESDTQQGKLTSTISPNQGSKPWQAFADEPNVQLLPKTRHSKSVRTMNGRPNNSKHPESSLTLDEWGFGQDSFTASPSSSSETSSSPAIGSSSQRFAAAKAKKVESSQPAGWAGF
ncbi:AP2-associated protein kinase 1 isoform X2 [Phalaenopsis equestris]|uniref:AP2-associated protein kinase 1 isoform X2 n=1 Tax=Phalaenopsis equestris TaxID=78828 RepID=UPI0009E406B1|nr:AP2-associated protein kinase 1 isoform X2 [Phalaenopsis equestris]